jgi:two-component system heavy metal sensor histidine kinase CusS
MTRQPMARRWMRGPMSISLRLGLLFAAIAGAVFLAVGAYLYQMLALQMAQRDDIDLLNKAVLVRQLLRTLPPGERMPRQMQMVLAPAIGQDGVMLRVATPSGQVLAQTMPPARRLPATVPVPLARLPRRADVVNLDGPPASARVLDLMSAYGPDQVRVTLMRTRSDRLAILRRYAGDLLGALIAGALLATALGFWAVRRALRPLQAVTTQADDINAQRLNMGLGRRLAPGDVPAELRALCNAFNAMLDRLEEGVQRLSGFAADLAHDMRTPVNALMMQTQVALSRERTPDEYQALLASNGEEYERLARMIENTLFLARADNAQLALRREAVDIGAELAQIGEYFGVLAEDQGVTLTLTAAPAQRLDADPVLLRRAVNNLVSNALAHTPPGGHVRLSATAKADQLAIAVANTGAGIAPEHLAQVFERYYRADPARAASSSAGLGLAIVRAIMRLHGGSARVESEPGAETVFTLCFPQPLS